MLSPTGQKAFGQSVQLTNEAHKNIIAEQRTDHGLTSHERQDLDDSTHLDLSQLRCSGATESTNNTSTPTYISTDSSKEKSTISITSEKKLEVGHYQQKDTGNQIYGAKDNLQEQLQQNKGHDIYLCSGSGGSENNESIQLNSNDTTEIENLDVKTLIKNCTLHATCEPPATAGSKNIPHLYSEGNTTTTYDTPSESNNDRLVHGTPLQQNHGMDTQNNAAMELNQPQQPPTISDLLAFMKQSQQQIQMENRQNQEKKEQQLQIVTGNQKQTQGEIMSQLKEHKQKLDGIADIPAQLQLQQQQQDEFQEIVMKQVDCSKAGTRE